MKKNLVIFVSMIFLISFVSANVVLEKEPFSLYNLKDKIEITAKIIPVQEINGLVTFYLSCDHAETEIYKEYIVSDKEIKKDLLIPLVKEFVGDSVGNCVIETKINENEETISKNFRISDLIKLTLNSNNEYEPGKTAIINGTAIRENGKPSDGIVEATLYGNPDISATANIKNGAYILEFSIPANFKAGEHNIELKVSEKNSFGENVNYGELKSVISIKQIPTSLEILLDSTNINPGETVKGKIVLRDQTGELMKSKIYVAIKNQNSEIIKKIEMNSNEEFEYLISSTEAPNTWTIAAAQSESLITRANFIILTNEEVTFDIINQTLIIENKGNVYYNHTISVDIGEKKVEVPVSLSVGETEKYTLSAPSGEYTVKTGEFTRTVFLTGNAINIQKLSDRKIGTTKIIAWIFIVLVFGLMSFNLFNRVKNQTFFGRRTGRHASKPLELKDLPQPIKLANSNVRGELSSSITGSKQNSPIGCINIKNFNEFYGGSGGVNETLNVITNIVEAKKGIVYNNKANIFFLIPPAKTKTFNNELPMLEVARNAKMILDDHNRKFKQKLDYGISLNYGTIVTTEENGTMKFMSMGTVMTDSKKLAMKSMKEILMSDKFKERLPADVKTEPAHLEGFNAFKFKEVAAKRDNSTFIQGFLERQKNNKL